MVCTWAQPQLAIDVEVSLECPMDLIGLSGAVARLADSLLERPMVTRVGCAVACMHRESTG